MHAQRVLALEKKNFFSRFYYSCYVISELKLKILFILFKIRLELLVAQVEYPTNRRRRIVFIIITSIRSTASPPLRLAPTQTNEQQLQRQASARPQW